MRFPASEYLNVQNQSKISVNSARFPFPSIGKEAELCKMLKSANISLIIAISSSLDQNTEMN